MVHSGLKGLSAYIKRKVSIPSTQVVTSLSIVIATALLVASTSIGTKYIASTDTVDVNPAQVKSTTARRDIGDAIDLSRLPETSTTSNNSDTETTIASEQIGSTNSDSLDISNTIITDSTNPLEIPITDKKILSFSFTSYINSGSDHQIVFNWETKILNTPNKILLKKTTNLQITTDDIEIALYENILESNYSDSITYNNLGSEGIYMELQYKNDLDVWVAAEQSEIVFG